jgi:ATP phosphoribosyltransferase regulatory subunit
MFINLQQPEGICDILPKQLTKIKTIEQLIHTVFTSWGYKEIRTPLLEKVDLFSNRLTKDFMRSIFKFQDQNGDMICLRPDVTTAITRIIAMGECQESMPIRLFYLSDVFRNNQREIVTNRQIRQAGVELVGKNSINTDIEILVLLSEILRKLGFRDYRIDCGYIKLFRELISLLNLSEEKTNYLMQLVDFRDIVSIRSFLTENTIKKDTQELFIAFLNTRRFSDLEKIITQSEKLTEDINYLLTLYKELAALGLEKNIYFDFGLMRELDYYSGLVFDISIPEIAIKIGGGGRYDNLIRMISNKDFPAIGFVLDIEKCLVALQKLAIELPIKKKAKILVRTSDFKTGVRVSDFLRNYGFIVIQDYSHFDQNSLNESYEKDGFTYVFEISNTKVASNIRVKDLRNNIVSTIPLRYCLQEAFGEETL